MKQFLFSFKSEGSVYYSPQAVMSLVKRLPLIERKTQEKVKILRTIIYKECEITVPKLRVLV